MKPGKQRRTEPNQAAMTSEDNAEIASESEFQETSTNSSEKVVEDEPEETEDVLALCMG